MSIITRRDRYNATGGNCKTRCKTRRKINNRIWDNGWRRENIHLSISIVILNCTTNCLEMGSFKNRAFYVPDATHICRKNLS